MKNSIILFIFTILLGFEFQINAESPISIVQLPDSSSKDLSETETWKDEAQSKLDGTQIQVTVTDPQKVDDRELLAAVSKLVEEVLPGAKLIRFSYSRVIDGKVDIKEGKFTASYGIQQKSQLKRPGEDDESKSLDISISLQNSKFEINHWSPSPRLQPACMLDEVWKEVLATQVPPNVVAQISYDHNRWEFHVKGYPSYKRILNQNCTIDDFWLPKSRQSSVIKKTKQCDISSPYGVPHLENGMPIGIEIKKIDYGSMAENAGLRVGDIILKMNGTRPKSSIVIAKTICMNNPVEFQIKRNSKIFNTVYHLSPSP